MTDSLITKQKALADITIPALAHIDRLWRCGLDTQQIALQMSAFLGRKVHESEVYNLLVRARNFRRDISWPQERK